MFTADQLLFHFSRGSSQIPKKGGLLMKTLFSFVERLAGPLLRISLGLVLLWIGSLHLQNPHSIVVLLSLSLPFLAYSAFVYVLGALEVIAGVLLIAGLWVRYVALLALVLFAGTLTIFVIAPAVTGFPILNLTGQFLLKDIVLASAAITVAARDAARHEAKRAQRTQLASRSEEQALSPVNSKSKQENASGTREQTPSQPL
jgi:uncharacterized membrane protein YkgB